MGTRKGKVGGGQRRCERHGRIPEIPGQAPENRRQDATGECYYRRSSQCAYQPQWPQTHAKAKGSCQGQRGGGRPEWRRKEDQTFFCQQEEAQASHIRQPVQQRVIQQQAVRQEAKQQQGA